MSLVNSSAQNAFHFKSQSKCRKPHFGMYFLCFAKLIFSLKDLWFDSKAVTFVNCCHVKHFAVAAVGIVLVVGLLSSIPICSVADCFEIFVK